MLALWQAREQTFTWLKKSPVFGIQQSGSPDKLRTYYYNFVADNTGLSSF